MKRKNMPRFYIERCGWEISRKIRPLGRTEQFLEDKGFLGVGFALDDIITIKHVNSGIQFRFYGYDAIFKWYSENFAPDTPQGKFSYSSGLCPLSRGFDSTYIGTTMIEQHDGYPKIFPATWESLDWPEFCEQICWADRFREVSGVPLGGGYPVLVNGKVKTRHNRIRVPGNLDRDLPEAFLNLKLNLFHDYWFCLDGASSCDLYVVLTRHGLFFSLCHEFEHESHAKRVREMTMYCNFQDNVVYREISERQDKQFPTSPPKKGKPEMELCHHEVGRLRLDEAYIRAYSSCPSPTSPLPPPAPPSSPILPSTIMRRSLAGEELNGEVVEVVDISDEKIAWLFARFGENIKLIQERTNTGIEIVPYFQQPRAYGLKMHGKEPRKAYICGYSKEDVDRAINLLNVKLDNEPEAPVSSGVATVQLSKKQRFTAH